MCISRLYVNLALSSFIMTINNAVLIYTTYTIIRRVIGVGGYAFGQQEKLRLLREEGAI